MTERQQTPAEQVQAIYQVLDKTGSNVVWELLRQSDTFYEWDHYPEGDVHDNDTHCQYYYHTHPPEEGECLPEHGHFHIFMRPDGMPSHCQPRVIANDEVIDNDQQDLCHLIAIAMDKQGRPLRLFTTNRWVTGETWYDAAYIADMLSNFSISHAWPSWPTNLWLNAIIEQHRDLIIELIFARDQKILEWAGAHSDTLVYEDRKLGITSSAELQSSIVMDHRSAVD